MKAKILALLSLCIVFGFATNAVAQDGLPRDNGIFSYHTPPRYRPSESHPLRTVAYVTHPAGWILREAFYRPWSAFAGATRFTRSFFGFREPNDHRTTWCFDNSDAVPDCRSIAPFNQIGMVNLGAPEEEEMDDDDAAAMIASGERQVFIPDVNFAFDKSDLNDLGQGRVRQIAQLLASVPSLSVVVEGHADYKGTDDYNVSLGSQRADTVKAALVELGIDPARMSVASRGESEPIFSEEEDWARAVNRRVQFSVAGAES